MKVLDLVLKILNLVKVNNFKDKPTTTNSGWKSEKTVLDKIIAENNNSGKKEKTHRS